MFADADTYVVTEGNGRTVHEWRVKPSRPDNHWLDCLVGCAVAAQQHSLADQIAADKYLGAKDAAARNPAKGFTRVKIVPPGTL